MKTVYFIFVSFFLLLTNNVLAHQEKSYLFAGKVNGDSVLFELVGHEEIWNARYFRYSDLSETCLYGTLENGLFKLSSETLSIVVDKKKWKLSWSENNKKVKTKLSLLDTLKVENEFYYKSRLGRLVFEEQAGEDSTILVTEKHSGTTFFRVLNQASDSMNQELKRLHSVCALHQIDNNKEKIFKYTLTHKSNFLCFSIQNNFGTEYFNYDIKAAAPFQLEDIIWFGEGEKPLYQSQEWFSYRCKVFPQKILPYLNVEDTCLNSKELWQFPTWYLQGNNLVLKPFTPFEIENCTTSKGILLPLSRFKDQN